MVESFWRPCYNQLVADALINNFDLAKAAANVQRSTSQCVNCPIITISLAWTVLEKPMQVSAGASFVSTDNDLSKTSSYLAGGLAVNWGDRPMGVAFGV